jgi:dipeptidyl aminopeptidase/acylaminoacyl peptidase
MQQSRRVEQLPRNSSRTVRAACIGLALIATMVAGAAAQEEQGITLERIMGDPDWIGNPPERAYFADDGKSVFFSKKRPGEQIRDLIEIDLEGRQLRVVRDEDRGTVSVAGGEISVDGRLKVYSRAGDLYVRNLVSGELKQLTRTAVNEFSPGFMTDDRRISFRRGKDIFIRDIETGFESQPLDLRAEDDPEEVEAKRSPSYLEAQQERLFDVIREKNEKKKDTQEARLTEQRLDPTRPALPFYLGKDVEIENVSLAPDGRHALVVLQKKKADDGKRDKMPAYVTESGYVENEEVRPKVGTGKRGGDRLVLLDLESHKKHELDLSVLPGIRDDILAPLREAAKQRKKKNEGSEHQGEKKDENAGESGKGDTSELKPRPAAVRRMQWSRNGRQVAVMVFSQDNKDRWIATVDFENRVLLPQHRLHDPGWINWRFNEMGWFLNKDRLWYLSEESGYSQLYAVSPGEGLSKALTSGSWEVASVLLTRDDKHFYFRGNKEHPGRWEVYLVAAGGGKVEQVTDLGGNVRRYSLSLDESQLLLSHSKILQPTELYFQAASLESEPVARRLTESVSEEFLALPWEEPEIVAIPSPHTDLPIYARLHRPVAPTPLTNGKHPAVLFIHGAGYMQNSHMGWSGYFREFMFHNLLARRGYVVLAMDYRASAGYGRDWRTAIYRHMGEPELQDLKVGVQWLVGNENVDIDRVGTYGGSYGGFMTLMALFKEPDLFAAGAALRPVTDWAHYNHRYTSGILNTPDVDPEAYERSSPIEFAEGLRSPLLIAHGMLDDNVLFSDTVRLVQKLIELGKEDWETAIYPVEPHGFREPSSWLDEYRRIFELFQETLERD